MLLRPGSARCLVPLTDFAARHASTVAASAGRARSRRGTSLRPGTYNQQLFRTHLGQTGGSGRPVWPVQMELSVWYNPTLESKNFVVPGMLVYRFPR